jgi:hypothetical protein
MPLGVYDSPAGTGVDVFDTGTVEIVVGALSSSSLSELDSSELSFFAAFFAAFF